MTWTRCAYRVTAPLFLAGLVHLVVFAVGRRSVGRAGVVALASGGLMIAERGGSRKLAHGVAMHGVLLLPALALPLTTTGSERRRSRTVALAAAGYCALIVASAGYNALV